MTSVLLDASDYSDTAGTTYSLATLCRERSYSIPADSNLTFDPLDDTLKLDALDPSTLPLIYTVTMTISLE